MRSESYAGQSAFGAGHNVSSLLQRAWVKLLHAQASAARKTVAVPGPLHQLFCGETLDDAPDPKRMQGCDERPRSDWLLSKCCRPRIIRLSA